MIPTNGNETEEDELLNDFVITEEPSLTYAMSILKNVEFDKSETMQKNVPFRFRAQGNNKKPHFIGRFDDIEAVQQAIIKILNTERYEYEIYSWDYGIELADLFGKSMPYVMSEIKSRITDALMADDRISLVDNFKIERAGKKALHCSFTVHTVQNDEIEIEGEVDA